MNATIQKTTNKSPVEIIFGRKLCRERWVSSRPEDKTAIGPLYPTKRRFQTGDEVLVKVETRAKDKERFEGPYVILDRIHDRRYRLQDGAGRVIERNVEKLKKFFLC
jgi:hypothetical protein